MRMTNKEKYQKHKIKIATDSKKLRIHRVNNRLCCHCGKKLLATESTVVCKKCNQSQKTATIRIREQLYQENKCLRHNRCGNPRLENSRFCYDHYFFIITGHLGGRRKQLANELKAKYEAQNKKCYYSNRDLILGVNAAVEHLTPKAKGGSDEIDNLVWADWDINRMKSDCTKEEFIQLCKLVSDKFKQDGN